MSKRFFAELESDNEESYRGIHQISQMSQVQKKQKVAKAAGVIAKAVSNYAKKKKGGSKYFQKVWTGPEKKYIDIANTAQTLSATGTVFLMNAPIQGTGNQQRVGLKVTMTSIMIKVHASYLASNLLTSTGLASNPGADMIRCVLVYDKQTNAAAPGYNDVYTGAGGSNVMANRLANNLERFSVLYDEMHIINSQGPCDCMFEKYLKVKLPTQYNQGSNTATSADIATGALYFMIVDQNTNGNSPGVYSFVGRVVYTDE